MTEIPLIRRKTTHKQTNLLLTLFLNDKILDWSKLKASAKDKINVNEVLKIGFGRVDNDVGKRENAGFQHFLLFP